MNFHENCIKRVYIMLGNACNFSCRHCIQEGTCHNSIANEQSLSADVVEYLNRLQKLKPFNEKISILFWGGEPLLYFDSVIRIVQQLGTDNFKYSMVSNGSLLNPNIALMLNTYGIHFTLSHDGINTEKVRGHNVLEEQFFLDSFAKIEHKSINSIISAYNCDYYEIWSYFDSIVPDVHINFEFLMCNWDMPKDLYSFNFNKYRNSVNKVVDNAFTQTITGKIGREFFLLSNVRDNVLNTINLIRNNKPLPTYPTCSQMRTVLNIDCTGNVYSCHNYPYKIGTIYNDFVTLLGNYDKGFSNNHSDCLACDYFPICRGGCPFSSPSFGKSCCCALRKIFYDGVLKYISLFSDDSLLEKIDLSEV